MKFRHLKGEEGYLKCIRGLRPHYAQRLNVPGYRDKLEKLDAEIAKLEKRIEKARKNFKRHGLLKD